MTTIPKIITVEPTTSQSSETTSHQSPVTSHETGQKSTFSSVGQDPWKAMATPSDIGDMLDAMNGIDAQSQYRGPIDWLSQNMVINDPIASRKLMPASRVPYVPDLHKDLFAGNPKLMDNMKPVVEKYEALLATLDELLKNDREALKGPMSELETQIVQKEIEDITRTKGLAEKNLGKARSYLDIQINNEKVTREKEKAEREAAIDEWSK